MLRSIWSRPRVVTPGTLAVTDPKVLERIQFNGLTERDLGVVMQWQRACQEALNPLVDAFYAQVERSVHTHAILHKHSSIERQRPMLTSYIQALFAGRIDDAYVAARVRVGQAHDRIDLDAGWFVAMYGVIRSHLSEAVRRAGASVRERAEFDDSLGRLIQVDMAICVQALMDSRREKLEAMNEAQKHSAEMSRFITEVASVLKCVAAGELSVRASDDGLEDHRKIKAALNSALLNVDHALGQVKAAASQVSSAAGQISAGSQTVAQGATTQAAALESIASNIKELTRVARATAENAARAATETGKARSATETGAETMKRLSAAMEQIKASSQSTAGIVRTIDEIAFQTNLLSLNASVEAARAGAAGRGFAVVAEEVRALALQAAGAAKESTQLIKNALANSERGVVLSTEARESFQQILDLVRGVNGAMGDMSTTAKQQGDALLTANRSVEELRSVTHQNAAASEQSASAAEELSGQAQELDSLVRKFELTEDLDVSRERVGSRLPSVRSTGRYPH